MNSWGLRKGYTQHERRFVPSYMPLFFLFFNSVLFIKNVCLWYSSLSCGIFSDPIICTKVYSQTHDLTWPNFLLSLPSQCGDTLLYTCQLDYQPHHQSLNLPTGGVYCWGDLDAARKKRSKDEKRLGIWAKTAHRRKFRKIKGMVAFVVRLDQFLPTNSNPKLQSF